MVLSALVTSILSSVVGQDCSDKNFGQEDANRYAHPIWTAVKLGREQDVFGYIEDDIGCLHLRGDVGETPVHWCFLYYGAKQRRIARGILEQFPAVATQAYEGELYYGETFLHLAIVHRDEAMVRFLLTLQPALLRRRATGPFFQPPSPCYYGETPLAFAVATNQIALVNLLLQHGADVEVSDGQGNSLLHLCVWHDLTEMYDHLLKLWPDSGIDPATLLNHDRLSPLTFAAKLGRETIFEHLMGKKDWEREFLYAGLAQYRYPLDELDYIHGDACRGRRTAIQIIVKEGHAEMLRIPCVYAVLNHKWDMWLHAVFRRRFLLAIVSATLFTVEVVLDDVEWLPAFCFARLCGLFLCVCSYWVLSASLRVMYRSGIAAFFRDVSLLGSTSLLLFTGCNLILFSFRTVGLHPDWEPPMLFIGGMSGWMHLFFYLRANRLTGPVIVMISQMLIRDFLRFFAIYAVFSLAHSTSFHVLCGPTGLESFLKRLELSIMMMVGYYEEENGCADGPRATMASILVIVNALFVSVLLVNLLIAMMGSTYENVSNMADDQWLLQWARIMVTLEAEIKEPPVQYWVEHNGKRYIRYRKPVEDRDEGYNQRPTSMLDDLDQKSTELLRHMSCFSMTAYWKPQCRGSGGPGSAPPSRGGTLRRRSRDLATPWSPPGSREESLGPAPPPAPLPLPVAAGVSSFSRRREPRPPKSVSIAGWTAGPSSGDSTPSSPHTLTPRLPSGPSGDGRPSPTSPGLGPSPDLPGGSAPTVAKAEPGEAAPSVPEPPE
eukprot:EG_transcript_4019